MDRRQFLLGSLGAATGIAAGAYGIAGAKTENETKNSKLTKHNKLKTDYPYLKGEVLDSAPCLQNFAASTIDIAFAVKTNANGYVRYWKKGDKRNEKLVKCGGFRVTDMNDKCMLVRLRDLQPSTDYEYVVGAWKINYEDGYHMTIEGYEESEQYSFRTAGKNTSPHFCVVNDTHENSHGSLGYALRLIEDINPQFVLWNGDACNVEESIDQVINLFLKPDIDVENYSSNRPFLFCPGNHDQRGRAARNIEKVWMFRQAEERLSRDWDLGRNFAVRVGQLALIGLDTGEDKRDKNKIFAGLFNNEAYRVAQEEWLKYALNLPEIKSAPFLVAACHIPLFDINPRMNPGDVAPKGAEPGAIGDDWDYDADRYDFDYTAWQRTCNKLWAPHLEEHGCQLIISAHTHKYRYDSPTKDRPWAQIVGGGNDAIDKGGKGFPTVIDVNIENEKLVVKAYNAHTKKLLDTYKFSKRNTK